MKRQIVNNRRNEDLLSIEQRYNDPEPVIAPLSDRVIYDETLNIFWAKPQSNRR